MTAQQAEAARLAGPLLGRRRWLLTTVAGVATVAGTGLAWRNYTLSSGAESDLWRLAFATVDGDPFNMSTLRGRPLLLNFWATWCPPCIEELPLLSNFYLQNAAKGWQVFGLAIDKPAAVKQFLAKTPVTFPVALAGLQGVELSRSLGNLAGGLPFTAIFDLNGSLIDRKIGRMTRDDLHALALPA